MLWLRNKKVVLWYPLITKGLVDVLKFKHQSPAKMPRQTVPTQIRLLLKNQSDKGVPLLLNSDKHFVNSSPDCEHLFENRKRKVLKKISRTFTVNKNANRG